MTWAIVSDIGDKLCNDFTNNAACQFDGGDCCLAHVETLFCAVCYCHETGVKHTIAPGGNIYFLLYQDWKSRANTFPMREIHFSLTRTQRFSYPSEMRV
jgi:hypothetical protein